LPKRLARLGESQLFGASRGGA